MKKLEHLFTCGFFIDKEKKLNTYLIPFDGSKINSVEVKISAPLQHDFTVFLDVFMEIIGKEKLLDFIVMVVGRGAILEHEQHNKNVVSINNTDIVDIGIELALVKGPLASKSNFMVKTYDGLYKNIKNELDEEKKGFVKKMIEKVGLKKTKQSICNLANFGQILYYLYTEQLTNQN